VASGNRARRWPAVAMCRTSAWTCSRTRPVGLRRRRQPWRDGHP